MEHGNEATNEVTVLAVSTLISHPHSLTNVRLVRLYLRGLGIQGGLSRWGDVITGGEDGA